MKLNIRTRSATAVKSEEASDDSALCNNIKCNVKAEDSNEGVILNHSNISMITKNISDYSTLQIKQKYTTKSKAKLIETIGTRTWFLLE